MAIKDGRQRRYFESHREERLAANRAYHATGKRAASLAAKRYGLSPYDLEIMWMTQGGLCGMCGEALGGRGRSDRSTHIDHDHVTQQVRGLLHAKCNRMLGWIESKALGQAQAYLAMAGQ